MFLIINRTPGWDWNALQICRMQFGCQAGHVNTKSLIVFMLVNACSFQTRQSWTKSLYFFLCLLWLTFNDALCRDDIVVIPCLQIKAPLTPDPWKIKCQNLLDHIFLFFWGEEGGTKMFLDLRVYTLFSASFFTFNKYVLPL